jgi:hypothetical protein
MGQFYVEGVATGGSSVTIVDNVERVSTSEPDDFWNLGTAFITYDAGGAGAAPQGEYFVISDFTSTTGTITLRNACSGTSDVAANDKYALLKKSISLNKFIIPSINSALMDIGAIPTYNSTAITPATSQTEYTLPSNAWDIRQVFEATNSDTNDNKWTEVFGWDVKWNDTGSAATLILPHQPDTSLPLMIVYMAPHPALAIYSDKLNEQIHIDRVVYNAAADVMRKKIVQSQLDNLAPLLQKLETMAATATAKHPIHVPMRPGKILAFEQTSGVVEDEPNRVYLT